MEMPRTIGSVARRAVCVAALLAGVVVSHPAEAGAADQSQGSVNGTTSADVMAQTFTAGLNGALDQADLHLENGGSPCPAVVEIRSTSGGVPTTTVLASTTIAGASIPAPGAFVSAFFAAPASVTAGTQYALVLTACGHAWGSNDGDPYAGGQFFIGSPLGVNADRDFAFRTFVVVLPVPTLTVPANGSTTNDTTPGFSGTAGTAPGDNLAQVTIEIYSGSAVAGAPLQTLTADPNDATGAYVAVPSTALANGTYTARTLQTGTNGTGSSSPNVFAVDADATNPAPPGVQPGPAGGTADTTSPDTNITSESFAKTRDKTPAFTFASNETNVRFECSVDDGTFAPCTSPHTLSKLERGQHTFSVRAIDQAGNVDPTPAQATFKVAKRRHNKG
jgi:hypothetical protein